MMEWLTNSRWVQIVLGLCGFTIVVESIPFIAQLAGRVVFVDPVILDPLFPVLLGGLVLVASIVASFIVPNPNDVEYARKIEAANKSIRDAERKTKRAEELAEKAEAARVEEQGKAMAAERAVKVAKTEAESERKQRAELEKRLAQAEVRQIKAAESQASYDALKAELLQTESKTREDAKRATKARIIAEKEADEIRRLANIEKADAAQILARAREEKQVAEQRSLECSIREEHFRGIEADLANREVATQNERKASEEDRKQAREDISIAIREREQAVGLRNGSMLAEANTKSVLFQITSLRRRLWPIWIAEGDLKPSFDELELMASGGEPNSSFLLSYLQLYHSIENHPELNREFNYLWPTVREIGRFLALTRTASGASENEVEESLREWARTINQVSKGRFTISVPTIGSPFSSSAMESKSGSIATVTKLHNWSISNSKSIIASKAEVS